MKQTTDLSVAHALTWRYAIALLLVASLSSAAWLSLHLVISAQKNTSAVINISGRQRMLSQRTALLSNLLVSAPVAEKPLIRQQLAASIELMAHAHQSLTHGDLSMGLPRTLSPAVHSLYFDEPDSLNIQVENYISAVRSLLKLDDDALNKSDKSRLYITQTALSTLVTALDRVVYQYQAEGEAAVGRLQMAETIFWLGTLILLMLEAVLIFHPFTKHIGAILGKLQHATDALQLHHDQLEATIIERTAELKHQSLALAESEEKFRLISTNAKDGIIIADDNEKIMYWNPAAETIFGYTAAEMTGNNLHDILPPEHERVAAHRGFERFQRDEGVGELIGKTFDTVAQHKNGSTFPIALSISAFKLHNRWHALGIVRDITVRKRMEEQVHQMAFFDALTQLPNRRLFYDRLNHTLAANRRSDCYGAILFLDLDNFKPLNDTHGHSAGDMLLTEAAKRLKDCARETDTVARIGGDEFVAMLCELDTDITKATVQAQLVAEKIREVLSAPYQLGLLLANQIEHSCTVSIGIALFKNDNQDDIMKRADTAMYQAKAAGRNQIRLYKLNG